MYNVFMTLILWEYDIGLWAWSANIVGIFTSSLMSAILLVHLKKIKKNFDIIKIIYLIIKFNYYIIY
jgi:hypothetical protein